MALDFFMDGDPGENGRPATWPWACEPGDFGAKYEHIFAYLALLENSGQPRIPGRLTMFHNGAGATVCLCNGNTGEVTFSDAPSYDAALEAMEASLKRRSAKWKKPRDRRGAPRTPGNMA